MLSSRRPSASRPPSRHRGATIALGAGLAVFLAIIGSLVASSLSRPRARMFAPTPAGERPARDARVDTLTIDAADDAQWRFVDLDGGRILPAGETSGWDLAVRRFHLVAADGAADLGPVALDSVRDVAGATFVATALGRDTSNAAMARWYDYRMLAHVLESKGHVYAVRTSGGRTATMQVIGYYCPGMRAGCVTVRYALLGAAGVSPAGP